MRPALAVLALAGVAAVLGSCGADADSSVGDLGTRTYLQQCSSCHGFDRGGVPPSPALPPERMDELGEAEVRRITLEGGDTMPGFAGVLSAEELDALVAELFTDPG